MKNSTVIQAECIVGEILQEPIIHSYEILDLGIVNKVCVVETENRKVVVRMNDKASYSSFVKESWCIEQASKVGIPGPEVLSIGTNHATAFMIQTFVDGENGLHSTKSKLDIWKQLGRYSKNIRTIPVKGYGEHLVDPLHGVFESPPHPGSDGSWLGYVNYNINSLTEDDHLIKLGVINQDQSIRIRILFEGLLKENHSFHLIHGDLSLKNTIITHEGKVVLLDWGSAEVHAAHGDIIGLKNYQFFDCGPTDEEMKAFLDGYGISDRELDDIKPVWLLRAFDNLRWAIDQSPDKVSSFAKLAKQVVDLTLE